MYVYMLNSKPNYRVKYNYNVPKSKKRQNNTKFKGKEKKTRSTAK